MHVCTRACALQVREHMEAEGVDEEEARSALMADPQVVQGVAVAANVSEAAFRTEIDAFKAEMGRRFDETQALLKEYGGALHSIEEKQIVCSAWSKRSCTTSICEPMSDANVEPAVQGHATNGDDAVRVPFPARVARVVALRW